MSDKEESEKKKQDLKAIRARYKGTVTRAISKLNRLFEEREEEKCNNQIIILKQAFQDFETSNNNFLDIIDSDNLKELNECEQYF